MVDYDKVCRLVGIPATGLRCWFFDNRRSCAAQERRSGCYCGCLFAMRLSLREFSRFDGAKQSGRIVRIADGLEDPFPVVSRGISQPLHIQASDGIDECKQGMWGSHGWDGRYPQANVGCPPQGYLCGREVVPQACSWAQNQRC